jgi:hypothetical protein
MPLNCPYIRTAAYYCQEVYSSCFHHVTDRCVSVQECYDKNEPMPRKNPAAVELGRRGGKATAENRTEEQRSDAARKAVQARWAKAKKERFPAPA